jgi:hypothetical protein
MNAEQSGVQLKNIKVMILAYAQIHEISKKIGLEMAQGMGYDAAPV